MKSYVDSPITGFISMDVTFPLIVTEINQDGCRLHDFAWCYVAWCSLYFFSSFYLWQLFCEICLGLDILPAVSVHLSHQLQCPPEYFACTCSPFLTAGWHYHLVYMHKYIFVHSGLHGQLLQITNPCCSDSRTFQPTTVPTSWWDMAKFWYLRTFLPPFILCSNDSRRNGCDAQCENF